MSAPHDWPAPGGTAGGCACDYCGVIFIGADWHDGCCAVCARDSDPTPAEKHKAAQFFHYEDWGAAQEYGGSHGPRVTADLATLLHCHAAPLREALNEAHDVLHECTAVLSAADCARVAGVMEKVRRALRDSDRNPEGEDRNGLRAEHESAGRQASPTPERHPEVSPTPLSKD